MNEMKPEDVMRALECCANRSCEGCPLERPNEDCVSGLPKAALALLREKDARIKELEEAQGAEFTCFVGEPHKVDCCPYGDELARLQKEVDEKDAEIERLNALNKVLKDNNHQCRRLGYEDAITEFAERLKYTLCVNNEENTEFFDYAYTLETIDQIAKDMKETEKGG